MLDPQDPNDVRNYSPEDIAKVMPAQSPPTEKNNTVPEHPLITSMITLLRLYPYIGVWTLLNDKLSHSVEIRIKLFQTNDGDGGSTKVDRPSRR